MSGRSGYRKTDRKRTKRVGSPPPLADYILRFQLPKLLAAFVAPGKHGWGVAIGYNDTVFVEGRSPAHCCDLAAGFFDKINTARSPATISATVIRLLPCSAHASSVPHDHDSSFKKLTVDVEAIHDRVSRFADRAKRLSIDVRPDKVLFIGADRWPFRRCAEYRTRNQA